MFYNNRSPTDLIFVNFKNGGAGLRRHLSNLCVPCTCRGGGSLEFSNYSEEMVSRGVSRCCLNKANQRDHEYFPKEQYHIYSSVLK